MSTAVTSRSDLACAWCGGSLRGKRAGARYCGRQCKGRASDARRVADGRGIARDRARYPQEADHRRAYARQYLAARPGLAKSLQLRRKARLAAVPVYRFTERDWRRLKARYRGACAYCGVTGVPLQREHVIPLARGGAHGAGNIVPACARCNYGKAAGLAIEWITRLRKREGVIAQ